MKSGRIPSLDGIRALAVLFVIVGHLFPDSPGALQLAFFGVHIFFVLSGYLITRLLQEEESRAGHIDLLAFYRRRCFRIFPAAFAYILLVALLIPSSRSGLIYAATYTVSYFMRDTPNQFRHLWSLSAEEQFYLLWPLALVLGFRFRAAIAWGTMFLAAVYRLGLANSSLYSVTLAHLSFPGTMDSIAAGCLLAIYEPQLRERLHAIYRSVPIAIGTVLAAWILDGALWADVPNGAGRSLCLLWGAVPLLLAISILLLIERGDRLLNNRPIAAIGVLSYSLYLWQQLFLVNRQMPAWMALALLSACAVASYFLVERPALWLGKFKSVGRAAARPLPS